MGLKEFLVSVRESLADLQTRRKVHIVIGNESCDLDSAVSAITYAYFLHQIKARPGTAYVPILNIQRDSFRLKLEVIYFLGKHGITAQDLIFLSDLDLVALTSRPANDFGLAVTLVDHHVPKETEVCLRPHVEQVFDHRPRDGVLPDSWAVTLEPVGSCCSLIARELLSSETFVLDATVAELLMGTILSDTGNMSATDHIGTPADHEQLVKLKAFLPPSVSATAIYEEIINSKYDLSSLTVKEMLLKDLKLVKGTAGTVAMSSVTQDLLEIVASSDFLPHLREFCHDMSADGVIIMTIVIGDSGIRRRCIAVFSTNVALRHQISNTLLNSTNPELDLSPLPEFEFADTALFIQNNLVISRKGVLPLVRGVLMGDVSSSGSDSFFCEGNISSNAVASLSGGARGESTDHGDEEFDPAARVTPDFSSDSEAGAREEHLLVDIRDGSDENPTKSLTNVSAGDFDMQQTNSFDELGGGEKVNGEGSGISESSSRGNTNSSAPGGPMSSPFKLLCPASISASMLTDFYSSSMPTSAPDTPPNSYNSFIGGGGGDVAAHQAKKGSMGGSSRSDGGGDGSNLSPTTDHMPGPPISPAGLLNKVQEKRSQLEWPLDIEGDVLTTASCDSLGPSLPYTPANSYVEGGGFDAYSLPSMNNAETVGRIRAKQAAMFGGGSSSFSSATQSPEAGRSLGGSRGSHSPQPPYTPHNSYREGSELSAAGDRLPTDLSQVAKRLDSARGEVDSGNGEDASVSAHKGGNPMVPPLVVARRLCSSPQRSHSDSQNTMSDVDSLVGTPDNIVAVGLAGNMVREVFSPSRQDSGQESRPVTLIPNGPIPDIPAGLFSPIEDYDPADHGFMHVAENIVAQSIAAALDMTGGERKDEDDQEETHTGDLAADTISQNIVTDLLGNVEGVGMPNHNGEYNHQELEDKGEGGEDVRNINGLSNRIRDPCESSSLNELAYSLARELIHTVLDNFPEQAGAYHPAASNAVTRRIGVVNNALGQSTDSVSSASANAGSVSSDRKWSRETDPTLTIIEGEMVTSFPERGQEEELKSFPGRKFSKSEDFPSRRASRVSNQGDTTDASQLASDLDEIQVAPDGLETDYLPYMDPLQGSMDIIDGNFTKMTDADREVVEGESFRKVSGQEFDIEPGIQGRILPVKEEESEIEGTEEQLVNLGANSESKEKSIMKKRKDEAQPRQKKKIRVSFSEDFDDDAASEWMSPVGGEPTTPARSAVDTSDASAPAAAPTTSPSSQSPHSRSVLRSPPPTPPTSEGPFEDLLEDDDAFVPLQERDKDRQAYYMTAGRISIASSADGDVGLLPATPSPLPQSMPTKMPLAGAAATLETKENKKVGDGNSAKSLETLSSINVLDVVASNPPITPTTSSSVQSYNDARSPHQMQESNISADSNALTFFQSPVSHPLSAPSPLYESESEQVVNPLNVDPSHSTPVTSYPSTESYVIPACTDPLDVLSGAEVTIERKSGGNMPDTSALDSDLQSRDLSRALSSTSYGSVKGAVYTEEWQDDEISAQAEYGVPSEDHQRRKIVPDPKFARYIADQDIEADDDDDDVKDSEEDDDDDDFESRSDIADLEWENDTPIQEDARPKIRPTLSQDDCDPHMRQAQGAARGGGGEEGEQRWKRVSVSGSDFSIDLHAVEPYRSVLSHGGYYAEGLNAIIVFYGCNLPSRRREDYSYVMNHLFHYVVHTLEELVAEDYVIIYFHGSTPRHQMPGLGWLRRCYQSIDRRLKKNLKGLFLVHPTLWLKTVVTMTRPFISTKFSSKLQFVKSLEDLNHLVPMSNVTIPDAIAQLESVLQTNPNYLEEQDKKGEEEVAKLKLEKRERKRQDKLRAKQQKDTVKEEKKRLKDAAKEEKKKVKEEKKRLKEVDRREKKKGKDVDEVMKGSDREIMEEKEVGRTNAQIHTRENREKEADEMEEARG